MLRDFNKSQKDTLLQLFPRHKQDKFQFNYYDNGQIVICSLLINSYISNDEAFLLDFRVIFQYLLHN